MKKLFISLVIFLSFNHIKAQNATEGEVIFQSDPKINYLLKAFKENNKQKKYQGYRIQIYSGSGKNAKSKAESIKYRFKTIYPRIPAYLSYNTPYFRVKIGDFRTKQETLKVYKKIQNIFDDCYPVKSTINRPKLQ